MLLFSIVTLFVTAVLTPGPAESRQCGFQTTDLNGTITSPEQTGSFYHSSFTCFWNITAPVGYVIHLQITRFNIPVGRCNSWPNPECCTYGYLRINGTTDENNKDVNTKLCGTPNFTLSYHFGNYVTIEYFHHGNYNGHYFTVVYSAVRLTAATLTSRWIANNTRILLSDKERLSFAVPALFLFDETILEGNETGYKFRSQYLLKLSEDLLRNTTQRLSMSDLSHHITALLTMCSNPRSFRGIDLVDHLRTLADSQTTYFSPFDMLTLCSAGEKLTSSDIKRLNTILKAEGTSALLLDFKAIAVMALICARDQVVERSVAGEELPVEHLDILDDKTLQDPVNTLKLHQKRDGGFGSLQTTSLVYQALSAARAHGWDIASAFKFISKRNHSDGSFGNLDDLYAVMPTLKNRHLLDINASRCDFSEDGATALREVKDKMSPPISATYQLWIGDEADVKLTITLKFPNGTRFVDLMRLAAEKDYKYRLKWTFVNDVIYVYQISDIINNPTSGKYWRLYTITQEQQPLLFKEDLGKYIPSDGDIAVMWYKTVDLTM